MNDDEFLTMAEESMAFLDSLDPMQYWPSRLPSAEDEGVAKMCDLFVAASSMQRQVIVSALSIKTSAILGQFSQRMAMLSVREKRESSLRQGLTGLVIQLDWPWTDPRDSVFSDLVLIYHSARKLGMDTDLLFQFAAQIATRQQTQEIVYPPKMNRNYTIEDTGWGELNGPVGLVYYRLGQPIPEGHLNP